MICFLLGRKYVVDGDFKKLEVVPNGKQVNFFCQFSYRFNASTVFQPPAWSYLYNGVVTWLDVLHYIYNFLHVSLLIVFRTVVCRCRFYSSVLSLCHSSWSYLRYHPFDIEVAFPLCTTNLNWYYTFLSLVYQLIKHLISNTTNCVFLTEPVVVPCYALIPLIPWFFWF